MPHACRWVTLFPRPSHVVCGAVQEPVIGSDPMNDLRVPCADVVVLPPDAAASHAALEALLRGGLDFPAAVARAQSEAYDQMEARMIADERARAAQDRRLAEQDDRLAALQDELAETQASLDAQQQVFSSGAGAMAGCRMRGRAAHASARRGG